MSAPTTGPETTAPWRPVLVAGLQTGPMRWNGSTMVGDVSVEGQRRVLRVGLREHLVIEEIDGRRTVEDIRTAVSGNVPGAPPIDVETPLQQLLAFGILERPFALEPRGLRDLDERADSPARTRGGVWAARHDGGPLRALLGRLARWPVFGSALALAVAVAVLAAAGLPTSVGIIAAVDHGGTLAAAAGIAILWNLAATLLHEVAHVGTFRALSGRDARLSITRLGVVPLLNTQLDGIGLLGRSAKVRVVASGPLTSLLALSVPVGVLALVPTDSFWGLVAAVALVVDLLVVGLSLSFFPNTDGTRILEAIASVDQLQAVAMRTLRGTNRLPRALPASTRITVRVYPILLGATVVAVPLAGVLTTVVALS